MHRWCPIAALALAGCHLIFPFDHPQVDGLGDGQAAVDASSPLDLDGQGSIDACPARRWSAPVKLPGPVNSPTDDWSPHLSPDQLTIYFKSWRSGLGQSDIWMATRPDRSSDFSDPVNLGSPVNSSCTEGGPSISTDGLTLFFTSRRRPGSPNCIKDDDEIWIATRADPAAAFSTISHVTELSSPYSDTSPHLAADELTLYFASTRAEVTGYDIWAATRASPQAPFTKVELVPGVNSPSRDGCPSLSADGLQLYLASDRTGGGSLGKNDIWVARRADPQAAFNAPTPIPELNTVDDEFAPFIAADGHTLYFNQATDLWGDPNKSAHIWISRLTCID